MLKKILLACSVFLVCFSPAQALPGDSYQKITARIKHHPFLATYYFFYPCEPYCGFTLTAFRQLQDGFFIDVHYSLGHDRVEVVEELILTQRVYSQDILPAGNEPGFTYDKRPWKVVRVVDVWEPQNTQALLLLEKIYGSDISKDFQGARKVFDGVEYVEAAGEYEARSKIREQFMLPIISWSNVTLYAGKRWGYERASREFTDEAGQKYQVGTLKIRPLKAMVDDVALLNHNTQMYQKYLQHQSEQDQRNSPADWSCPD